MTPLLPKVLLLFFAAAAHAGTEVGNGGDAVVCYDTNSKVTTVEMLDAYEARETYTQPLTPNLGAPTLPLLEKVQVALNFLSKMDPARFQTYSNWAQNFTEEDAYVLGELTDISDSQHIVVPFNCRIEQIVIQRDVELPFQARYTIRKDYWDRLDNDNKAILILHEILYREGMTLGLKNSIPVRNFNAQLFSGAIAKMATAASYMSYLKKLGFDWFSYLGLILSSDAKFYPDGSLRWAHVIRDSNFTMGAITLNQIFSDDVEFYKSGVPRSLRLGVAQNLKVEDVEYRIQKQVGFFDDGTISDFYLAKPMQIVFQGTKLEAEGFLAFHQNLKGEIRRVSVTNAVPVPITGGKNGISFDGAGSTIETYSSGVIKSLYGVSELQFQLPSGKEQRIQGRVDSADFSTQGQITALHHRLKPEFNQVDVRDFRFGGTFAPITAQVEGGFLSIQKDFNSPMAIVAILPEVGLHDFSYINKITLNIPSPMKFLTVKDGCTGPGCYSYQVFQKGDILLLNWKNEIVGWNP